MRCSSSESSGTALQCKLQTPELSISLVPASRWPACAQKNPISNLHLHKKSPGGFSYLSPYPLLTQLSYLPSFLQPLDSNLRKTFNMQWFTIFAIPIVVIVCWLYTVTVTRSRFPKLRNKRICLLIAHPDDEAMFFAPMVLALTDPALGNHLKILCLSSGTLFLETRRSAGVCRLD